MTADSHRRRAQIEAELDFVAFARARGVSAAQPVRSHAGELVVTLDSAGGGADAAHAVAFEEMPGRHFAYRSADIGRPLFERWGRAMGALHAASREFRPAPGRRRHQWSEDDVARCSAESLPAEERSARREHERVHIWLAQLPRTPDNYGLIHGDFERTNFLLDGGERLHVFDFDDACYHWYLADVAHALWAFRGAAPDERRRFLGWFAEGYGPVDDEALSWLVRMRSLALFIRHLRTPGGADAAWAARVRAGFDEPFRW